MLDIIIEIFFREINEETNKNIRPLATNLLGQLNMEATWTKMFMKEENTRQQCSKNQTSNHYSPSQ